MMVAPYRKGFKRVIRYYSIGGILTLGFSILTGWKASYLPPVSVAVIICVLMVGLLWATLNITDLPNPQSRLQTIGELTAHVLAIGLAIIVLVCFRMI
jgi:hypothetical protein